MPFRINLKQVIFVAGHTGGKDYKKTMDIKEEILYDFATNMPRILVSGNTGIIDDIKKIVLITERQIIVSSGKRFTAILGNNLIIKSLGDERMLIEGEIEEIRFYGTQDRD